MIHGQKGEDHGPAQDQTSHDADSNRYAIPGNEQRRDDEHEAEQ